MRTYIYIVADYPFTLTLPEEVDVERLLPSFRPFRVNEEGVGESPLFRFEVVEALPAYGEVTRVLDEAENDLGLTRIMETTVGFLIELRFTPGGAVHRLFAGRDFTEAKAVIRREDPYAGESLSALLRIVCAQAVLLHGGISVHAAAVSLQGRGYLFMGKSGTGKSTHAALWQRVFEGCELINDDNPIIRMTEEGVRVYGTPWSGKTPCYRNLSFPVEQIVRLRQSTDNRFHQKTEVEAFITLLPGCSALRTSALHHDALCDTLVKVVTAVSVGELECRPDEEAVKVCKNRI